MIWKKKLAIYQAGHNEIQYVFFAFDEFFFAYLYIRTYKIMVSIRITIFRILILFIIMKTLKVAKRQHFIQM